MRHSLGVLCRVCDAELVSGVCRANAECFEAGRRHGHTYQEPGEYAARTWPDHPCFRLDAATAT